jgi:hypothetical protein
MDVTWLDTELEPIQVYYSTPSGATSLACYQKNASHGWPHEFYTRTILPNSVLGSEGFGFPLSKEGGNWSVATNIYKAGMIKVLGTGEILCVPSALSDPLRREPAINFSTLPNDSLTLSSSANVILHGIGFTLKTSSPAWLTANVQVADTANFLSFEAKFLSRGAEGVLSVYVGTNLLGSIDERVALPRTQEHIFPLGKTVDGRQMLGFRLDAFSETQSSAFITNVVFGFAGVREPFSLSYTGMNPSGGPILQLVGPTGFNYRIMSSTDLIVWNTISVLVNTNGLVRFIDQTVPNAPARFYRAVVP